jgi:hypothetical protein
MVFKGRFNITLKTLNARAIPKNGLSDMNQLLEFVRVVLLMVVLFLIFPLLRKLGRSTRKGVLIKYGLMI